MQQGPLKVCNFGRTGFIKVYNESFDHCQAEYSGSNMKHKDKSIKE